MKNLKLLSFFLIILGTSQFMMMPLQASAQTTTANIIFTDSVGNSISSPYIDGKHFIMNVIFTTTGTPTQASINSTNSVVFGSWGSNEFLNPSGNTWVIKMKLTLSKDAPNQIFTQTWTYTIESYDNGFVKLLDYNGTTSLSAPLPVLFTKVSIINNVLTWETAQEINNKKFVIQISSSLEENWVDIHEVAGAGNSNEVKQYSMELPWNIENNSFIRIKQVDFDGKFDFSQIVKFSKDSENPKIIDQGKVIIVPEGTIMTNITGKQFLIKKNTIERAKLSKGQTYFLFSPYGEKMKINVL